MIIKDDFPIAKTQAFKLNENIEDVIIKIISSRESNISFSSIKINSKLNGSMLFKDLDKRITDIIKSNTESMSKPNYTKFIDDGKCYFFYISENKTSEIDFLSLLHKDGINIDKLLQSLIHLAFKDHVIKMIKKDYNVSSSVMNDDFFIGSILQKETPNKNQKYYLDTFKTNFTYSKNLSQISFSLISKTFESEIVDELIFEGSLGTALFKSNDKVFKIEDDSVCNSTKCNKTKFMEYKGYYGRSKNYFLNLMYRYIVEMFNKLDISFMPVNFKADAYSYDFLNFNTDLEQNLIIVDDYEYDDNDVLLMSDLHKQLKEYFHNVVFVKSDLFDPSSISKKNIYLFINKNVKNKNTSIRVIKNGKEINPSSFLGAYEYVMNPDISLDLYTNLKKINFKEADKYVTQGLNLDKIIKSKKEQSYSDIDNNKLLKIERELWLKKCIFMDKKISDINLEDGEFTLFYSKNFKSSNKKNKFISVVNISILNKELFIKDYKIYDDINRFNMDFRKNHISKINISKFSDSFYIYDKENDILMTSYTSVNVPQIIGNTTFDSLGYYHQHETIRKQNGYDISALPYYLSKVIVKGNSGYIYMQNNKLDLFYFVSEHQNPRMSIDKQRLIYCLKSWDKSGNEIKSSEQKVVNIFLSSFTFDLLNNKEVSKSSILEKISKEFLLI